MLGRKLSQHHRRIRESKLICALRDVPDFTGWRGAIIFSFFLNLSRSIRMRRNEDDRENELLASSSRGAIMWTWKCKYPDHVKSCMEISVSVDSNLKSGIRSAGMIMSNLAKAQSKNDHFWSFHAKSYSSSKHEGSKRKNTVKISCCWTTKV